MLDDVQQSLDIAHTFGARFPDQPIEEGRIIRVWECLTIKRPNLLSELCGREERDVGRGHITPIVSCYNVGRNPTKREALLDLYILLWKVESWTSSDTQVIPAYRMRDARVQPGLESPCDPA